MSILTDEQILAFIRNHKDDFHKKYGVHKIGLFGSFARKEQTEASDVDIAIEMEPGKRTSITSSPSSGIWKKNSAERLIWA